MASSQEEGSRAGDLTRTRADEENRGRGTAEFTDEAGDDRSQETTLQERGNRWEPSLL